MKYIVIVLLVIVGLVGVLYREIKLSREAVVMPPNPVKLVFKTDWHTYETWTIPFWDNKTHTK